MNLEGPRSGYWHVSACQWVVEGENVARSGVLIRAILRRCIRASLEQLFCNSSLRPY
jgi:hypothetical protein